MSNDNPDNSSLDKTSFPSFSDFLDALKKEYNITLSTDFSDGSPVSRLLNSSSPIKVEEGRENILYEARGSPLTFSPFNFGATLKEPLTTIVMITVTQELN